MPYLSAPEVEAPILARQCVALATPERLQYRTGYS